MAVLDSTTFPSGRRFHRRQRAADLAFAFASTNTSSRFVFIILRGALDGLTAVPPYGDPDYARLSSRARDRRAGNESGAIKLTAFSVFTPTFGSSASRTRARAGGVPRNRQALSGALHFDGQDVLENGSCESARIPERLAQSRARVSASRFRAQGTRRSARPECAARDERARGGVVVVTLEACGVG